MLKTAHIGGGKDLTGSIRTACSPSHTGKFQLGWQLSSAGSQYGYASITPKTAGAFTGLQSPANTWGPFHWYDRITAYNQVSQRSPMGPSTCPNLVWIRPAMVTTLQWAFKRMLIKSRDIPWLQRSWKICAISVCLNNRLFAYLYHLSMHPVQATTIDVINPSPNSYTWSTTNGVIIGLPVLVSWGTGTWNTATTSNAAYSTDSVTLLFWLNMQGNGMKRFSIWMPVKLKNVLLYLGS